MSVNVQVTHVSADNLPGIDYRMMRAFVVLSTGSDCITTLMMYYKTGASSSVSMKTISEYNVRHSYQHQMGLEILGASHE